jgi:hypothetical protein
MSPVVSDDASTVTGMVLGVTGSGSVPFAAGGGTVFGTSGADDGSNTLPPLVSSYLQAAPNGHTLVVHVVVPVSLALPERPPADVSVCVTDEGPTGESEKCDHPTASVHLAMDEAECLGSQSGPCLVDVRGTVTITGSSLFEGVVTFTHAETWQTYTRSDQGEWGL